MRGSEALTKEIRDAAVTYERVYAMLPDGYFVLACGHKAQETKRNPAHWYQVRYCQACTEAKLRQTGEI
jgi:hypothetical protein